MPFIGGNRRGAIYTKCDVRTLANFKMEEIQPMGELFDLYD